jgi:hypothetical protein
MTISAPFSPAVKKIKKFRIVLRPSYALRHLRGLMGGAPVTPELERELVAEADRAKGLLSTAAVYATVKMAEAPDWAREMGREDPGPAEPVAVTFLVATAGPALEEEVGAVLGRGEALLGRLWTAVGEEAADQSAHFVNRLLQEEAKLESCELSPWRDVPGNSRGALLDFLDAGRVAVCVDAEGRLSPRFSRVAAVLWRPTKKKR